jgi:hypothetical protein
MPDLVLITIAVRVVQLDPEGGESEQVLLEGIIPVEVL